MVWPQRNVRVDHLAPPPTSSPPYGGATQWWVVDPFCYGVTSAPHSVSVLCPTTNINHVVHLLQSVGDKGTVAMELTKALFVGLPPIHQLFALLCLVVVIYKFTNLLIEKRNLIRVFEAFPGPPGHWLFGHVFQVMCKGFGKSEPCLRNKQHSTETSQRYCVVFSSTVFLEKHIAWIVKSLVKVPVFLPVNRKVPLILIKFMTCNAEFQGNVSSS